MKKRRYLRPGLNIEEMEPMTLLEGSSVITNTGGNGGIGYGGGGHGPGRAPKAEDVVDEEEENDSIIQYRNDPMDFIPKSFKKILDD